MHHKIKGGKKRTKNKHKILNANLFIHFFKMSMTEMETLIAIPQMAT